MSTDSVKMDTGIPLFFSEIQYLLLETIPLETIMRVPEAPVAEEERVFGNSLILSSNPLGNVGRTDHAEPENEIM